MDSSENQHEKPIAVAVITPSGIYPTPDDYRRGYSSEVIKTVLDAAAEKLGLKNTADWDAYVENAPIDPSKSFAANDLSGIVEIEWHKREGGGGA